MAGNVLMVQGTASHVGKSVLVTALPAALVTERNAARATITGGSPLPFRFYG